MLNEVNSEDVLDTPVESASARGYVRLRPGEFRPRAPCRQFLRQIRGCSLSSPTTHHLSLLSTPCPLRLLELGQAIQSSLLDLYRYTQFNDHVASRTFRQVGRQVCIPRSLLANSVGLGVDAIRSSGSSALFLTMLATTPSACSVVFSRAVSPTPVSPRLMSQSATCR